MRGCPHEEAFSRHLLTTGHAPSTVKSWARVIACFGEWCFRHEISPLDASRDAVQRYLAEELGRVGRNTVAMRLSALRAFYAFLDDDDHRTHGLRVRAEEIAPRIPFTEADIDRLLAACRNDRDRAMVTLAARLGMRIGEIVALRPADLHPDQGVLIAHGKGGRDRLLTLDADVWTVLAPHIAGSTIWRMKDGRPMTVKRAQRNMEEIARRAGVAGHWHRFRTTFANRMIRAGMPLETLRRIMGHKQTATTERYAAYSIQQDALDMLRRFQADAR